LPGTWWSNRGRSVRLGAFQPRGAFCRFCGLVR
jgi:hypothetical protein